MAACDHTLDLIGLKCPLPALKTAKFLKSMPPGETVLVLCTDPLSVIDIPNLIANSGDEILAQREEAGRLVFEIRKA